MLLSMGWQRVRQTEPLNNENNRVELLQAKQLTWASLVAQMVKHSPAMQETRVRSLGWEDPLEEGVATHSSILGWRRPMNRGAWRATVHEVLQVRILEWVSFSLFQGIFPTQRSNPGLLHCSWILYQLSQGEVLVIIYIYTYTYTHTHIHIYNDIHYIS